MKSRRLRYCLDIRDRVSTEIAAFTESRFYDVIFRNARETFTLRYVKLDVGEKMDLKLYASARKKRKKAVEDRRPTSRERERESTSSFDRHPAKRKQQRSVITDEHDEGFCTGSCIALLPETD